MKWLLGYVFTAAATFLTLAAIAWLNREKPKHDLGVALNSLDWSVYSKRKARKKLLWQAGASFAFPLVLAFVVLSKWWIVYVTGVLATLIFFLVIHHHPPAKPENPKNDLEAALRQLRGPKTRHVEANDLIIAFFCIVAWPLALVLILIAISDPFDSLWYRLTKRFFSARASVDKASFVPTPADLQSPLSLDEINQENRIEGLQGVEPSCAFGQAGNVWNSFKSSLGPSDALWLFRAVRPIPDYVEWRLVREGYASVRDGAIVRWLVVSHENIKVKD